MVRQKLKSGDEIAVNVNVLKTMILIQVDEHFISEGQARVVLTKEEAEEMIGRIKAAITRIGEKVGQ